MRKSGTRSSILHRLAQALCLALAGSLVSGADDDPPQTTYVIGVENIMHLPYYGICDTEYCGFGRDLLDAFAAAQGVEVLYRPLPIPRLHRALASGLIDAKFPANPDWAQSTKGNSPVLYSDPVVLFTDGFLTLPEHKGAPEKVGTMRGFTIDMSVLGNTSVKLFEANAEADLFNLLVRGRVDTIYTNINVMRAYLRREGIPVETVIFRRDLPFQNSQYFLSTTTKPLMIDAFNRWLEDAFDEIQALKKKHHISEMEVISSTPLR
ncbi:substrate-binding periplasmic protein [Kordiimonas lacus]|uniref:substrate-binding periplasmic protein n=1 Tax=Kordiimonas lacus TaxID=637679 RepID=UPI0009E9C3E3|nr:transporter substrate-binding domain-containing protein [Kordiimonas lacus]